MERGQEVALKVLLGLTPLQVGRFGREVMALTRLRHPGLVRVLDAGESQGVPWMAMELVPGESLQARLERTGPLPVVEAVTLVSEVADALAHAHAHGVLHRDLKPANVLLRAIDGRPVVTDFGLARQTDSSWSESSLSLSGRFQGTPGYCAPEQARGDVERIGPPTDVFGLGGLLVALLTGEPPGGEPEDLLAAMRVQSAPPEPPSRRRPEVDAALDAICVRALARDPDQRPPSARALAAELDRWMRERARRRRSRGSGPALFVLALLLVAVGGAILALRQRAPRGGAGTAAVDPLPDPPGPPAPGPPEVPAEARAEAERLRGEATSRMEAGDQAGARTELDRALELDPGNVLALAARAMMRWNAGDPQGAARDLERALELDPHNVDALLGRGIVRRGHGDRAGARADYDRVIELAPGRSDGWVARGGLRIELGDLTGAVSDYQRALATLPPASQQADLVRRQIQELGGTTDGETGGASDLAEALEHARRLVWEGDLAGARRELDDLIARQPQAKALALRSLLREQEGDATGARADLDLGIRLAPRDATPWHRRALLRGRQGDARGAWEDFSRAIALDPTRSESYLGRGLLAMGKGDLDAARGDLDRAVELAPADAEALCNRGALREAFHDLPGAMQDYERAVALNPRSAFALHSRACGRRALGDLPGARADLDRAVELRPDYAPALAMRGGVREDLGDTSGALSDYRRALALFDPGSPDAAQLQERLAALGGGR